VSNNHLPFINWLELNTIKGLGILLAYNHIKLMMGGCARMSSGGFGGLSANCFWLLDLGFLLVQ
jgi:hypothetical protein